MEALRSHCLQLPTAAAHSVMVTPLIKHIVGMFGMIDASSKSMTAWLTAGKSIVLYIGGIAELFLTQPDKEVSSSLGHADLLISYK